MVGQSLLPILTGERTQERHRDYVRCEYLDALDLPDHSRATMYFDGRYKIVLYHNHSIGELFDLAEDRANSTIFGIMKALVICAQIWCGVPLTQHYQHCTPAPIAEVQCRCLSDDPTRPGRGKHRFKSKG